MLNNLHIHCLEYKDINSGLSSGDRCIQRVDKFAVSADQMPAQRDKDFLS